jgi:hypothetical protein
VTAAAAFVPGGRSRGLSSLDAVADGDPIWGSITWYNGLVLSSGGGDTAMRGQQVVAVDHRAIEMVVQSWLAVGLLRRRPSRRGAGVDRALDSECKNR